MLFLTFTSARWTKDLEYLVPVSYFWRAFTRRVNVKMKPQFFELYLVRGAGTIKSDWIVSVGKLFSSVTATATMRYFN